MHEKLIIPAFHRGNRSNAMIALPSRSLNWKYKGISTKRATELKEPRSGFRSLRNVSRNRNFWQENAPRRRWLFKELGRSTGQRSS